MVVKAQVQPLKLRSKTEPSSIPGRPGKKLQVKEWTAILKQSKSEKGLCKYIYMKRKVKKGRKESFVKVFLLYGKRKK